MAFDGTVVACIADELNKRLANARISKVAQPEKDALILTLKNNGAQERLLISANPSLPMIYLTGLNLPSPINAPAFCMLLRKHLTGGRILCVSQPSLERIINIEIEHFDEMGDLCRKTLVVELMGKHSNIIFLDGSKILDSIRHVSALVSSVREVLPGRDYFIPFSAKKLNPFKTGFDEFSKEVFSSNESLSKAIYMHLTGISPQLAEEIAYRAEIDSDRPATSLTEDEKNGVYSAFSKIIEILKNKNFNPVIVYDKNKEPFFYAPFEYKIYEGMHKVHFESISELLYAYYSQKQQYTSIRQKTADIRQIVNALLNKDYKKYDIQLKQLKDTEKRDKYRLYGELITAYGYGVEPKATSMKAEDYNTGEEITIPLDPTLSAIENGKKYFEKYSKLKRTFDSLNEIIPETKSEITHLESISASLDTVKDAADIAELKKELIDSGYIRAKNVQVQGKKGKKPAKQPGLKSSPLHFVSSDGFDMYVGKNNYQNEYISFKLAEGNDWWFHAKKLPGSHVIVKSAGKEVPDTTFEEAASLAAHFSKADGQAGKASEGKVEVDYVQKKFLKKTPGGKPGFVIYHTNYSMSASTDISNIQEV